jgi:beta-phosphoglucomutase-like phosphatase (HAD superfamily)
MPARAHASSSAMPSSVVELPGGQLTVGPHVVPESELQGLIFDLDGTLIDSMPLFYPAWPETCKKFELPPLTLEEFYGFAGVPMPDIVRAIHRNVDVQCDDDRCESFLGELKAAQAREEARKGSPKRIECVFLLATAALTAGQRVAIATSGVKEHVRSHLALTGLDEIFSEANGNLVCASDLPRGRGKPLPDIYLEAARRIGCEPSKCRAYEDGESGLCAAYRAGMHVIDVTAMTGKCPTHLNASCLPGNSNHSFWPLSRLPGIGWFAQSKSGTRARPRLVGQSESSKSVSSISDASSSR